MDSFSVELALAAITFGAAIVNGALGYGFSSITVPLALLFLANRVLNPALVLIEVVLNGYVLWNNRDALGSVWRRVMPMVIGLVPGVIAGTAIVAQVHSGWLRFVTFIGATAAYQALFMGLYVVLGLRSFPSPWKAIATQALGNAIIGMIAFTIVEALPGVMERRRIGRRSRY